ncbi:hypothetical protein DFH06DRAFT_595433 [Mycena polygramma]|nr:hypothetical protein DFH06DRAFT_595433 [Mycena polygramma]
MPLLALSLCFYPLLVRSASIALQNITIVAPVGTTQHGDEHLLCVPAQTWDILTFFAANYLAHAATVRPYPGESQFDTIYALIAAVLFPTSGIVRGVTAIARRGFLGGDDFWKGYFGGSALEVAARSGALCMVIRTRQWKPVPGTQLSQVAVTTKPPARWKLLSPPGEGGDALMDWFQRRTNSSRDANIDKIPFIDAFGAQPRSTIRTRYRIYTPLWMKDLSSRFSLLPTVVMGSRAVHGTQNLPEGYAFAYVPRMAKVVPLEDGRATVPNPERGVIKGLVSLGQAVYAFYTLYQARGDQISRYGYAAFGLTVLPYAAMSTINLVGAILTPEFPSMYLVQSDTLLEAQDRLGAKFEGVVGRLLPPPMVASDKGSTPRLAENVFSGMVEADVTDEDTSSKIDLAGYSFHFSTGRPDKEHLAIEIPVCGEFQWTQERETPLGHINGTFLFNGFLLGVFTMLTNLLIYGVIFLWAMKKDGIKASGPDITYRQRIFVLLWLLMGSTVGLSMAAVGDRLEGTPTERTLGLLLLGIPAFGGFYSVGQMLVQYGICTQYD